MKLIEKINVMKTDKNVSVSINNIKFNDDNTVTVRFSHYTAPIKNSVQTFEISDLEKVISELKIQDILFYDVEELLQMMGLNFKNLTVSHVNNDIKIAFEYQNLWKQNYFQIMINKDKDILQELSNKIEYLVLS